MSARNNNFPNNNRPSGGPPPGGPPMGGPGGGRPPGGAPRGGPGGHGGPMGMGMGMPGEKARNFKDTMKTLIQYLKPYRTAIILAIILSIASTVFAIVGPKLQGNAINILFDGIVNKLRNVPEAAINFHGIGVICLELVALYLASAICSYIVGYVMTNISMRVTYDLRKKDF